LRLRLVSADRFNDSAMRLGLEDLNTDCSRSSASLLRVTWADQRRPGAARLEWRVDDRVDDRVDERADDERLRAAVRERLREVARVWPRAAMRVRPRAATRPVE
jgi:hypothetical protein